METGRQIDRRELDEAVRLMNLAADLGGDIRRSVERKSANTFWQAINATRQAGRPDRVAS